MLLLLLLLLKESEKKGKYHDLPRELEIAVKVMIIPIVIGALGTVIKGFIRRLKDFEMSGRVETIQATTLLRLARIVRRVLET